MNIIEHEQQHKMLSRNLAPSYTTPERDLLSGITYGMIIYNSTTKKIQAFVETSGWVDLH